jgi:nitrite reductase (NO-forming)
MNPMSDITAPIDASLDRRSLLRRAAGVGIALPAIGVLNRGSVTAAGSGALSAIRGAQQAGLPYDPVLPAVQAGPKEIAIVAKDAIVPIATDVTYAAWTFDGTVPGRTLRVVEGDEINFTLSIDPAALVGHSLDFHSAQTPPDINYRTINPGESLNWSFTPKYPGAYMYHCGTPPVLMHIGIGMYGAMIVDPKEGWSPAQEFIFVQSEFYVKDGATAAKEADFAKMIGYGTPDYVVFNGQANQYVANPIPVKVGEPIRIFVVNAGPNVWSSFHVVGAIFDSVYLNANPKNQFVGMQSVSIGPGDGACVEFTIEEPGFYPAVNHAFGHASQGAVAMLAAT